MDGLMTLICSGNSFKAFQASVTALEMVTVSAVGHDLSLAQAVEQKWLASCLQLCLINSYNFSWVIDC